MNPESHSTSLNTTRVRFSPKRKILQRDGKFWDMIYMGVLREEWEKVSEA